MITELNGGVAMSGYTATLDEITITEELDRRLVRDTAQTFDMTAVREVLSGLASQPEHMLPKLVAQAMSLTGACSAGISVFEPSPAPGLFRWHHLFGLLAPFEGATTPRNSSPCGVTVDLQEPVLMTYPERFYAWIEEQNLVIPEVLLVPLFITTTQPFGTLWIVADKPGHFCRNDARLAVGLGNFISMAWSLVQSRRHYQEALREQEILAQEMSHRVKNVFAIMDSMIRLTERHASSAAELAESLTGRLHAMAESHALIRKPDGSEGSVDLTGLIKALVKPYSTEAEGDVCRVNITGESFLCLDSAANGLTMVFHELATNAAKYGSLSDAKGQVQLKWSIKADTLLITWREIGGPPVKEPQNTGFGTTLITQTVCGQFGGSVDFQWKPSGLHCEVSVPLEKVGQKTN
jgi:two-component sensor histidine kinase